HRFAVGVVPLHGTIDAYGGIAHDGFGADRKHVGMQHSLGAVDVFNKAFDPPQEGAVFFFVVGSVTQADLHAVVQEGQFAQTLGQNVVAVFDVLEDLGISQKLHARTRGFAGARYRQGRYALSATEFHFVQLSVAGDRQAQPL